VESFDIGNSRRDAQERNLRLYYGAPCKRCFGTIRSTKTRHCMPCRNVQRKEYESRPEVRERNRERLRGDPKKLAANRRWLEKAKKDPKFIERERKRGRDRAKRDKHKWVAVAADRRARRLQATPPWTDEQMRSDIKEIYAAARRQTDLTGVSHHVDHIHPLRGENFCGLHVPWNLCIMRADQNISKGNRLPPDVPTWGQ
jgi:hypothetical protein